MLSLSLYYLFLVIQYFLGITYWINVLEGMKDRNVSIFLYRGGTNYFGKFMGVWWVGLFYVGGLMIGSYQGERSVS